MKFVQNHDQGCCPRCGSVVDNYGDMSHEKGYSGQEAWCSECGLEFSFVYQFVGCVLPAIQKDHGLADAEGPLVLDAPPSEEAWKSAEAARVFVQHFGAEEAVGPAEEDILQLFSLLDEKELRSQLKRLNEEAAEVAGEVTPGTYGEGVDGAAELRRVYIRLQRAARSLDDILEEHVRKPLFKRAVRKLRQIGVPV